jgi:hypothetical protein
VDKVDEKREDEVGKVCWTHDVERNALRFAVGKP